MKPVNQTIYNEGAYGNGDCLRACVASILELDIEFVPNFVTGEEHYLKQLQKFLKPFGLQALTLWTIANSPDDWKPDGYHLIYGYVDDVKHAVVGYKGEIVHDPHPKRDERELKIESWTVFVSLLGISPQPQSELYMEMARILKHYNIPLSVIDKLDEVYEEETVTELLTTLGDEDIIEQNAMRLVSLALNELIEETGYVLREEMLKRDGLEEALHTVLYYDHAHYEKPNNLMLEGEWRGFMYRNTINAYHKLFKEGTIRGLQD